MLKPPGAMCPKCNELFPAEHQQIGQPARWTCLACGASGELAGSLSICKPAPAPAPKAKPVHPHWAQRQGVPSSVSRVLVHGPDSRFFASR